MTTKKKASPGLQHLVDFEAKMMRELPADLAKLRGMTVGSFYRERHGADAEQIMVAMREAYKQRHGKK